ncbi:zinc finger protein 142-like [Colias croceus]|uniref:zinc finger protein 142-like n=1 Tax=Colias crocea TaxID=72248 RepID=UPI001E27A69C|nr:zinc finger protein 142-like [Colias croceus]
MFRSSTEVIDRGLGTVNTKENYDDEMYSCDKCSEGDWYSETEVECHKQKRHKKELLNLLHGNSENLCKMCLQIFEDRDELIKHIKTDHLLSSEDATRVEREIFICDECHCIFFNKRHLALHIIYHHYRVRGQMRVECPKCEKFIRIRTLWFHFLVHKIQSVASCKICFYKCKNRQHLREHVKSHPKHLYCAICQYETKKEDLFKQHLALKHKNSNAIACNPQPYFVPKYAEVRMPKLSSFLGLSLTNNVRLCVLCREICVGDCEMHEHIKVHMSGEKILSKLYSCVCGEQFFNKVLLKHHIFKLKGIHREKDVKKH